MTDELLEICLRRNVEGCFFHLPCRAPSQSRNRLYRRRNFRTRCRKPAGDWCPSLRTRSPYNLPGNHFESALGVPQLVCLDSRCIWPVQGGEKKKETFYNFRIRSGKIWSGTRAMIPSCDRFHRDRSVGRDRNRRRELIFARGTRDAWRTSVPTFESSIRIN